MRPTLLEGASSRGTAEAAALMSNILEASTEYAIIGKSLDGTIVLWNEGACRIYGYAPDEVVGIANSSILHVPEDVEAGKHQQFLETALRDGKWEGTINRMRKNGERFIAHGVITPRRDAADQPIGFLLISKDISGEIRLAEELRTLSNQLAQKVEALQVANELLAKEIIERRSAEARLNASEKRLRAVVNTAIDAIVVIDECGIVQSVNPAVERIFGYQSDEIVGKSVNLLIPDPERRTHDGHIGVYLRTGISKIIGIGREVQAQRKSGQIFPVDLALTEWRIEDKRYFTGIMRDITNRKQAEEHVRFVIHELSHRTKNVLAVVQTMAWQTARTSHDLEDFGERFAKRIEALACSHDLLTKRQWQGVRLEDLVLGQLHSFGAEEHLDVHGPDLVLKPQPAQTLGLALHELATNAAKYGALTHPAGRIEVGWSIDPEDVSSRQFRMYWRESGGPEVSPPQRNGFGRTVTKDMTERALKGEVVLEFRTEGLFWQFAGSAIACLANLADVTY